MEAEAEAIDEIAAFTSLIATPKKLAKSIANHCRLNEFYASNLVFEQTADSDTISTYQVSSVP